MLTFAPIFTDHAVLQREKPIRLFGTGDENTIVTARLMGVSAEAPVHDGCWEIVLPPLPAGGPCTLTISDGTQAVSLEDIMLGEVWLCGGQSNMELALKDARDPQPALDTCADSNVRLYHVCKRGFMDEQFFREEAASCWQLPSPETCPHWTAVGYFFAQRLAGTLGVTVGLVSCNYGGTSASAWMSEEMLASTANGQLYLEDYRKGTEGRTDEEADAAYDAYLDYHCKWCNRTNAYYAAHPGAKWDDVIAACGENQYPGPHAPKNPLRPHGLYDTMIRRIIPYTLRGVLYYQGESDEHRAEGYASLLTCLIAQWRRDFRDEMLPFLLVQLPMFRYAANADDKSWCRLREAQAWVFRNVKNTGLAAIPDCGEFDNIHPTEKREPARRLYLQALSQVYGLQTENTCAPMFRQALPEPGALRLQFDYAECGLELRAEGGFELCGTDGIWHPAQASVNLDEILLRSDAVSHPMAARYAWYNYGDVTVYAKNGLPLAPFRTMAMD